MVLRLCIRANVVVSILVIAWISCTSSTRDEPNEAVRNRSSVEFLFTGLAQVAKNNAPAFPSDAANHTGTVSQKTFGDAASSSAMIEMSRKQRDKTGYAAKSLSRPPFTVWYWTEKASPAGLENAAAGTPLLVAKVAELKDKNVFDDYIAKGYIAQTEPSDACKINWQKRTTELFAKYEKLHDGREQVRSAQIELASAVHSRWSRFFEGLPLKGNAGDANKETEAKTKVDKAFEFLHNVLGRLNGIGNVYGERIAEMTSEDEKRKYLRTCAAAEAASKSDQI